MTDTLVQRIRGHVKVNEKPLDFPYPDNKGKITAGVGFLIDDQKSFMKQTWEIRDEKGTRPATDAEKLVGWQAMQKAAGDQKKGGNKRAESYENITALRLPQSEIDAQLEAKVNQHMNAAKKELGEKTWDKLTDGQKTAITDVHYANGSLKDYTKLNMAAKSGNAEEMALQAGFHSGENADNTKQRNWDRERRNYATILGIDPDSNEAWQGIAGKYKDEKNLPDAYRKHLPPEEPRPSEPPVSEEPQATQPPREEKASLGADGQAFLDRLKQPLASPALEVAIKAPHQWTEDEAKSVIYDYQGRKGYDPMGDYLRERTSDFYKFCYGSSDWQRGLDGKMHETRPGALYATKPQEAQLPDGRLLMKTLEELGAKLAPVFDAEGFAKATTAMQRGLNLINDLKTHTPRLKEDGDWGPVTDFSFKKSVATYGPAKLDEGFALGRLQSLAEKRPQPEELASRTQDIFGPLYGSHVNGPEKESYHAYALQTGLNEIGPKHLKDWQPLTLDGEVGPKTTDAFNQLAQSAGPLELASGLGKWLGWV
ncbi:MAG: hypothetical protein EPN26_09900 [Rhodospirillales bacterium]|nr:MAG: hypothetical protein EPN26_09900 [Rhodospirillales bacterium]